MSEIVFGYMAFAIVALSILVISMRNPVHSVLLMLVMFFHVAALYLFLNAEFIAAIQVILYSGGILVLFLFVVMMLNLREFMTEKRFVGAWPVGLILTIALSILVFASIKSFIPGPLGQYDTELIARQTQTVAMGTALYTEYLFPFEVASLVLLVAVVGAITLAKKHLHR
jgi:NADH-quinone oxidoreductase subunit J